MNLQECSMRHLSILSLITALAISLAPSESLSQPYYSSEANPSSIGTISVSIIDEANGACWTNLREVREYAEEKISSKGYNLVKEKGEYYFDINLNSFRVNNGMCVGSYKIQIASPTRKNGVFGFHEIGAASGVATMPDNFNRKMIELVQYMTESM
jgi:hypothetical protein